MADSKVSVSYIVNSSEYNKNITQMKKNMQLLNQEVKTSAQEVNTYGKNIETLSKQQSSINQALAQSKKIMAEYESTLSKNNESLEKNRSKLSELAKQKEEANQAYKEAIKTYGEESEEALKAKEALEKVNQAYEKQQKVVTSNENAIRNNLTQIEKTKQEQLKLEQQLEDTNKAIEEQGNKFINASEKFASAGSALEKAGGSIKEVGEEAQKAGALILTASTTLATMASGYESGLAKVNTLVMDSKEGIKEYGSAVMDLSNNTGKSVTELTDALYDAISAGVDYSKSTQFINDVNKVAVGGFTDIASASNLLTQVMNIYGKSVDDVGDISNKLFLVQKNGVTTVGQLASSMGEAMTIGASYNVSLENILSSYASLTKQGRTASTAQTQLKAMIQELGDTGSNVGEILKEKTAKSFTQLMKEGNSLYDVLKIVKDSCKGNEDAFNNLWSSTEAGLSAMSLLSKDGEYFNSTLKEMANSAGLTDQAFDIMANTTEYKFKKSINEAKNSLIKLGESLLPLADDVSAGISKIADVISKINPEVVTSIAKFGALSIVFGTVMKATGNLVTVLGHGANGISTLLKVAGDTKNLGSFTEALGASETAVGGLINGFSALGFSGGALASAILPVTAVLATITAGIYAFKEGNEACNSTIADTKGEYTLLERGMASLMGTQLRTREELEASNLVYKDFNENISEEFQNKVRDMTTDVHEFGFALNEINLDGIITEEEANGMAERVSSALDSCKSAIYSKYEELQSGLQEAFSVDGVIEENETVLIEYWNNRANTEKAEAEALQNEINIIIQNARNEGRTLTSEEEAKIKEYYAQIKQIELEALASNQYEIEYATTEFNNRIKTMDAESAKELLGQRYKDYQEQQIATKTNYDTLISMAMDNYENLSLEDKKHVDETIKRLEESRDEELKINKDKYDNNLQYAIECNENLKYEFNKFTGEMVAERDRANYSEFLTMTEHYSDLDKITQSGYKAIYDTTTGTWHDCYVKVNETTGQLEGVYDLNTQNLITMTKNDESALADEKAAWEQTTEGILANSIIIGDAYTDLDGNVRDSSGNIIGYMEETTDANGDLIQSIYDLNGKKIDIKGNWNEATQKANEVSDTIQNIKDKTVTISVKQEGYANVLGSGFATKYAKGTNYAEEGIANINEQGWELVDPPKGRSAFSLGKALQGEMAYIPEGTKISSHLTSTQQMLAEIDKNVNSKISELLNNKNNVLNINNIENLMNSMIYLLKSIERKDINLYLDGNKISDLTYKYTKSNLMSDLRGGI